MVEADEKLAQLLADRGEGEEAQGSKPEEKEEEEEPLLGDLGKGEEDYQTLIEVAFEPF